MKLIFFFALGSAYEVTMLQVQEGCGYNFLEMPLKEFAPFTFCSKWNNPTEEAGCEDYCKETFRKFLKHPDCTADCDAKAISDTLCWNCNLGKGLTQDMTVSQFQQKINEQDNLGYEATAGAIEHGSTLADGMGVGNGTGIQTTNVDLSTAKEVADNKAKNSGLANQIGSATSFAGNDSEAALADYAKRIGSQEGINARNQVSTNVDKVHDEYGAKSDLAGKYNASKVKAENKGKAGTTDVADEYKTYNASKVPTGIDGKLSGSTASDFQNEKVKKGTVKKDNLEQIIASDTKENENKTSSYIKNLQDDTRTNVTARKETPRLFTNRTGYVKSAWKASDKFAAWEVVGAVDALLEGATSIEADTGSVGRVGQSTDQNSYSAAQINYRGVKTEPQSGGY